MGDTMPAMDASTTVTVAELRTAISLLLDEAERRFGATIDLGADHYWDIDAAAAFNLYANPTEGITAGQLTDDIASMRQFIRRPPNQNTAIWHEASHLCGILRRVGAMDRRTP
jgi:hypothetical protein